ncbi:LOW QUALITY PROTEIN: olfactory receptor 5G25-like [Neofelis nebulosa]|uniref:LOW QUALITY PROTEIN: olfactory receptor 5G25-like n=1 Tax=Neofelis nebulosa TaxID=61452 RepID=UPI00272AFAC7|nr:LOW QUALITY PROTEIN: olfactory receptor 5G25-like [Neofelis nebulosa]XP_058544984.1 LOW QUALITY PROTEIN: olfactory receptor 5G25-like [Neofelis nebulosa]
MEFRNQTLVTEFLFVGLTNCFQHQVVLFVVFLLVYLVTLLGNVGMITLIGMDSRLHTPMYFFLSHLSFVDVCSSSVIGPRMLTDIFVKKKVISFLGCAAQLWFFGQLVVTECFLLASMAYDRYMAICKPLLYTLIMSRRICVRLVVGPYTLGLMSAMTHTTFAFRLPYCGPNTINHFFCDLRPVLSLACADTQVNQVLLSILAGALGVLSGVIILVSYIYIVVTVLRIRSAEGRRKAFSTCSSHLTAVSILCGTLFFIYVRPSSSFSLDINKVVSVFYTAVIPMLNPLIYSLRNKEVKDSFRRTCEKKNLLLSR